MRDNHAFFFADAERFLSHYYLVPGSRGTRKKRQSSQEAKSFIGGVDPESSLLSAESKGEGLRKERKEKESLP